MKFPTELKTDLKEDEKLFLHKRMMKSTFEIEMSKSKKIVSNLK